MKFSIVIPVYGTERFLPRCLDSLVAQTDGDFEAIIVDDCSPGAAGSSNPPYWAETIVKSYDARFKCVRHESNLSLLQARLTGLRQAEGDYVVPLDSDDYVLPGLLAALRKEIDSTVNLNLQPQPDVLVYQMMYDDGKRITKPSVIYRDERLTGAEARDRFFESRIQCAICGKAVRRAVYLKAMEELAVPRDFYLNSSEDLCQTFPVLVNAQSVATLSYPGYRYWLNGESLTTTLTDPMKLGKAAENTRRVFDTLSGFIQRNGYDLSLVSKLSDFRRPTLRWYLSCIRDLSESDWQSCVTELCRWFDPAQVAREAMLLITESRSYRIGALITRMFKSIVRR